jgi:site-specific DNA-cytosine methylase
MPEISENNLMEETFETVSAGDIPSADLLVGGFPCATFSSCRETNGILFGGHTRDTLAFEMFRLAQG